MAECGPTGHLPKGELGACHPTGDPPKGDLNKIMHYVYLLKSKEYYWHYIGCSSNLRQRVDRHNAGMVKATKYYRPLNLIYYEAYEKLDIARKREYDLKNNNQQREILYKRLQI